MTVSLHIECKKMDLTESHSVGSTKKELKTVTLKWMILKVKMHSIKTLL